MLNIFGFLPNGWVFSQSLFSFTENNFYNSQSCNSSCIQKLCAVLLLFVVVSGSRAVSMGCAFAKAKVFRMISIGRVYPNVIYKREKFNKKIANCCRQVMISNEFLSFRDLKLFHVVLYIILGQKYVMIIGKQTFYRYKTDFFSIC